MVKLKKLISTKLSGFVDRSCTQKMSAKFKVVFRIIYFYPVQQDFLRISVAKILVMTLLNHHSVVTDLQLYSMVLVFPKSLGKTC